LDRVTLGATGGVGSALWPLPGSARAGVDTSAAASLLLPPRLVRRPGGRLGAQTTLITTACSAREAMIAGSQNRQRCPPKEVVELLTRTSDVCKLCSGATLSRPDKKMCLGLRAPIQRMR